MKEIKVGLIGFGTVGSGVGRILQKNSKLIEKRMGAKLILKRIADIDINVMPCYRHSALFSGTPDIPLPPPVQTNRFCG